MRILLEKCCCQMTPVPLRLALFSPDIPQNTGTLLRLGACLGLSVEVIEPAGFDLSERMLRRSALDYADLRALKRHRDFETFLTSISPSERLVLMSVHGAATYTEFRFAAGDVLLAGRESAGVPPHVRDRADAVVGVPMTPGSRSLNMAVASAMVVGEALRQIDGFPS